MLPVVALCLVLTLPARVDAQALDTVFLEELTWTELRGLVRAGKTTVLLPIGGTEQNGPHMALGKQNRFWWDVLENGPLSRYASYFDIDWKADDKVLLPILGRPLEEALAAGEIKLAADELRYYEHRLPLVPGGLARQHYRLAWWRGASDRINWRRFLDINELVCLRMEEPEAFEAVHTLPLRLHAEGLIDGLRIDHVDGLADARAYLAILRRALDDAGGRDAFVVVEIANAVEGPAKAQHFAL